MLTALLATKLRQPALPARSVPRPRLAQRLAEGLEVGRTLTLVSAPAGSGKTTCVAQWVQTLALPIAWLSLDEADDEPGRFFSYLVAALQQIDAALGRRLEGVLLAGMLPPGEVINTTLSNDIMALPERFVLVLDDFHLIQEAFILDVVERLVADPPAPMHLVLVSREEPALPLARLRAYNRLTEIHGDDLRFEPEEADQFFNEALALELPQADVAALAARTEGWVAGLQLAGLSLRDGADRARFIGALSGNHHQILAYLTEEVLEQQPPDIQQFLLQTSILERLSGPLCNAVSGREDGYAMLARIHSANLFLVPLDEEHTWYRYHKLFADLLRNVQQRREPQHTATLHRRAGEWYAGAEMAAEAMGHALRAPDYALAVRLVERHAMRMLSEWHVQTVAQWLHAIPEAWLAPSAYANLVRARLALLQGQTTAAEPFVARLEAHFARAAAKEPADQATDDLQGQWLVLQTILRNREGRAAESLALAQQALALLPPTEGVLRGQLFVEMAQAYQQLDGYEQAVAAYRQLIEHGRLTDNLGSTLMGVSGLGLLALQRGQLALAHEAASVGLEQQALAGTVHPISTAVYGELGQVYYQRHELEEARACFAQAAEVSALSGFSDAAIYESVVHSRLLQMDGDLQAAAAEIERAGRQMQQQAPAAVREEVIAQQVRVALALDQPAAAQAALDQSPLARTVSGEPVALTEPAALLANSNLRICLYRGRLHQETEALREGLATAGQLLHTARRRQLLPVMLETLLLRAQMHAALGDEDASRADYREALRLAQPEGFITVFVAEGQPVRDALRQLQRQLPLDSAGARHAASILAAFAPAAGERAPGLIERLTERELDVLKLMAEGLTYKAIAAQLFISTNTVRTHVKGLYGKLGARNRTGALARAREHGLLE